MIIDLAPFGKQRVTGGDSVREIEETFVALKIIFSP